MANESYLPQIICSSCGSFVGNKYLEYTYLVANDYPKLNTFQSLSINSYCCRMLIENPIVVSTNYGDGYENVKPYKNVKKTEKDDAIIITIKSDIRYFNTFTERYVEGSNGKTKDIKREDLASSLNKSLATRREYVSPEEKVINLDLIHEEVLTLDVGYEKPIRKISKVYIASDE